MSSELWLTFAENYFNKQIEIVNECSDLMLSLLGLGISGVRIRRNILGTFLFNVWKHFLEIIVTFYVFNVLNFLFECFNICVLDFGITKCQLARVTALNNDQCGRFKSNE